jgi:hypothetical protein
VRTLLASTSPDKIVPPFLRRLEKPSHNYLLLTSRRERHAPLNLTFVDLLVHNIAAGETAATTKLTPHLARSFAFEAILAVQADVGQTAGSSAHQTPDLAGSITGQAHFLHKRILCK